MDELVLTAIPLAGILWIVLRIGKRQARHALRMLSVEKGGVYQPGGLLSRPHVLLTHGGVAIRLRLSSLQWHGGRFLATLEAPWLAPRPDLPGTSPAALLSNSLPGGPGGEPSRPPSAELRMLLDRLLGFTAAHDHQIRTYRGAYHAHSILTTAALPQVTHWFETSLRIYTLLAAETEAGIEFGSTTQASDADVCCQVCGAPPAAEETVYCQSCGAPHHHECWEYNRGCAIYGCRTAT